MSRRTLTCRGEDEKDGGRREYVQQSGWKRGRGLVVDVVIGRATCSREERDGKWDALGVVWGPWYPYV